MRPIHALVVAACLSLLAPLLGAEGDAPRDLLEKANDLRGLHKDYDAARDIYLSLVKTPGLDREVRADALIGVAICYLETNRPESAIEYLDLIIAESETLRPEAVAWARGKKAQFETTAGGAVDARKMMERIKAEQRRQAREKVEEAQELFAKRQYDAARMRCFAALNLDGDNKEAEDLLQKIENERPDRGGLLSQLIQFVQTAQLEQYQRVVDQVRSLWDAGKRAFDTGHLEDADRMFRRAIALIDGSGFLSAGGALSLDSLAEERARLLGFLRETHDRGEKEGLSFEPEPRLPDVASRDKSLHRQFYSLLEKVFTQTERSQEKLGFYDFAPDTLPKTPTKPKRGVVAEFFDGLQYTHRTGTLTRSRWAERWIRSHIGLRWRNPTLPGAPSVATMRRSGARILMRFGSLVCAQHREDDDRIERLRTRFADVPPPLRIDARVYATTQQGTVVLTDALGARAGVRESGVDLVIPNRGLEECERVIAEEALVGVVQLGHATIHLDGLGSVTLEVTDLTSKHPAYVATPRPDMTIPDRDARYGLWLELYAEDMPHSDRPGNARSALSVRARIRQPDSALPSHVVPKRSGPLQPYTRLPAFTEQVREADRELSHFATFLMCGLSNPFPPTRKQYPELVLLIGARPQGTAPDVARSKPPSRIEPPDLPLKEYPLGPLALEVEDQMVPDQWPDLRTAAEGMPLAERRRRRDQHLADLIRDMAGLDLAPLADRFIVQEGRLEAKVSTPEHHRVDRAVLALRAFESDHYAVTVETAAVPHERWQAWSGLQGATANTDGNLTVSGDARAAVLEELAAARERGGPFDTQRPILARATQQKVHRATRSHAITRNLRVHDSELDDTRYSGVPGAAEDGIVVEVRPRTERPDGTRFVWVRARAARLLRIESRAYPGATNPAARYDVPIWHEVDGRSYAEAKDEGERLGDTDTLLLPLPMPGDPTRVIVVAVTVAKVR